MKKQSAAKNSRCATGIPGLDDVLNGGLPGRRFYLVQGAPGSGKTTLALQFLREGVRKRERGLYISLSETLDEIHEIAHSHEWSLEGIEILELAALEESLSAETSTLFHPSEVELSETMKVLVGALDRVKPARFVLDSLSELALLAQTPLRYRREVLSLKQHLSKRDCTGMLLDESGGTGVTSTLKAWRTAFFPWNRGHSSMALNGGASSSARSAGRRIVGVITTSLFRWAGLLSSRD